MSASRLDPIVAAVRCRAGERRKAQPLALLRELVRGDPRRRERFLSAFASRRIGFDSTDGSDERGELGFIAELKRRSPSAGALLRDTEDSRPGTRWSSLAQAYRDGGAAAISVLTEQDHFGGSLDDLRSVEPARLPRLRKDFVLDEGMLLESCLHGADAVLLLPSILEARELAALRATARELGLAVLLEVHDERELDLALPLEPELLGVNARDLRTFEVDLATVERLLPRIPAGPVKVAESGIRGLDDLKRVRDAGARAVLVGEALVRSNDPRALLRSWKEGLRG